MHADIRDRGPVWLDWATLAFSLLTVIWVAFIR
jgi:hypothetical protein